MKFIIGGYQLQDKELLDWAHEINNKSEAPWIQELAYAIIEWYDPAEYITFKTSGSTSIPKNIVHSKKSMEASARKTAQRFQLRPGMMTLNCLPVKFVAGKMMLVRALTIGLDQVCIEPKIVLTSSYKGIVDFAAMTPMQLEGTLDSYPSLINRIKKIIVGGAPVSQSLLKKIQNLDTSIYGTYGMTETITHIAINRLNGLEKNEIFEALKGVRFSEQDGDLVIYGDHLDEPEIRTHDQIELHSAGQFRWLGRSDNVINSGGIKIHPEALERKIEKWIDHRFFITGIPDQLSGQSIALVIESEPFDPQKLLKLSTRLSGLTKIEQPRKTFFVPELLETPTGKVKRKLNLYPLKST